MKPVTPTALLLATVATMVLFTSQVEARQEFVALIPNGDNVPDAPAIGHTDNTGDSSSENAFGKAFASAGLEWTTALCEADTDGDGQTNGQELGDPCCEWTKGGTPRWTDGVSHPSDASKTSDESLWANIDCSNVTTTTTSSASTLFAKQGASPMSFVFVTGVAAALGLAL